MGFARKLMVSAGWTIGAVLGGSLKAQSSGGPAMGSPQLRASSLGRLDEGAPVYTAPDSTVDGVLQEMASRAAVIFTGTVRAVKRSTGEDVRGNAAASVVEVQFAVDQAVVGVAEGTTYVMREWAGLWRDSPRFVPGQRVLALLHSPGPSGLSSPVDGLDGVLPITGTDSLVDPSLGALTTNTVTATAPQDAVDMRWLQAKTLKTLSVADASTAGPGETIAGSLTPAQNPALVASATTAQATVSAGVSHVLGLLRTQQETRNVAH